MNYDEQTATVDVPAFESDFGPSPSWHRSSVVESANENSSVDDSEMTVDDSAIDSLDAARMLFEQLRDACRSMVQGRDDVIDLVLIALLADGHVLLEDHPGSGKTTLARSLGECIAVAGSGCDIRPFRRVQFTPDLLPSDVTGATVFEPETQSLSFQHGPIFGNVVLADEINRTNPKVQAALLEAMAEKQVTIDNQTYELDDLFFVIATQNPLDRVGTWPLPRAQLDRFLFKIRMTELARNSELDVLRQWKSARSRPHRFSVSARAVSVTRELIREQVHVDEAIEECLVDIAMALRKDARVVQGATTRSLVQAIPALQVRAAMQERDFVSHEDIETLCMPLFAHRLELVPGAKDSVTVVGECVQPVLEDHIHRTLK